MIGKKMKNMKNLNPQKHNDIEVLQLPGMSRYCNISHFITTRHGGVSKDAYASLNMGLYSGDDEELIRRNYDLLSDYIGIDKEKIIVPHQTHGTDVLAFDERLLSLDAEVKQELLEGVDALVTDVPGICVSVLTADCVPVLLYAPDKEVVASVHAGWRGTVKGIVGNTIYVMAEKYGVDASNIVAAIGPSISLPSFEVGDEVLAAFADSGLWTESELKEISIRNAITGKAHIDLWKANSLQMLHYGVRAENIEVSGICTYTDNQNFFSARRLGINSGRIMSGIFIKDR